MQSAIGSYQNSSALLWYRTLSSKSNLMCSIATWDTAAYSFLDFKIFGPLGTAPRMRFYIDSTSMLELNSSGVGINGACQMTSYLEMQEMTAPSAPASNRAYLYLDDNGSGKTRLMVRFSSGSAIQLAIQP